MIELVSPFAPLPDSSVDKEKGNMPDIDGQL